MCYSKLFGCHKLLKFMRMLWTINFKFGNTFLLNWCGPPFDKAAHTHDLKIAQPQPMRQFKPTTILRTESVLRTSTDLWAPRCEQPRPVFLTSPCSTSSWKIPNFALIAVYRISIISCTSMDIHLTSFGTFSVDMFWFVWGTTGIYMATWTHSGVNQGSF